MSVFERCLEKCRVQKGTVVYSDGEDRRVVSAAAKLIREGIVDPILIGDPEKVRTALQDSGETGVSLQVVNPLNPALVEHNAAEYMAIQKAKGKDITEDDAIKAVSNGLSAGALMVRRGEAEIGVAGNLSSTANVIRAGLRMIGTAAGSKTVSSFFFMLKDDKVCMFTDCAVIPDPTPAQLADIAIGTSGVYKRIMGEDPRVALLSFSTKGSAKHERVDKVRAALDEIKTREPDLLVDGELQLDAAVVPEVAQLKAPGSPVAGNANVFVFPSLEAGNIGYKIAQRFGGWTALGPLLQGFAHGWHDLSRGCSSDDIYKISVVGLGMSRGGQQ